jgi:hypothetical protein
MTIAWTGFPASTTATASDVVGGLSGGISNARFNANSWLIKANNLSDVAVKATAFNNISPLTTTGDTIIYNSGNVRLGIGSTGQIYTVVAGLPAWVANPGLLIANNLSDLNNVTTARTNLGLGTGSSPTFTALTTTGINKVSVANALTAHSGGGQGSALALTVAMNRITTVAASGDSVKLPAAAAGEQVVVVNAAASNAMDCFPTSGDAINALSANTALSIAADSTVLFCCIVAGTWNAIVTA